MLAAAHKAPSSAGDCRLFAALERCCPGAVKRDEPMSRHTTIGAGGPARYFAVPRSARETAALVRTAIKRDVDYLGVGRGSNLVVRDGGFDGLIVKVTDLAALRVTQRTIHAEAGVSFTRLGRTAWKNGRPGFEFAVGIPGSVGGAVRMNAGAFGSDIARILKSAKVLNERGQIMTVKPADLHFNYRYSALARREIVLSAIFNAPPGELDEEALERTMVRKETQPLSDRSFGSTFRNPTGDFAARMIEECGLKGYRMGGVMVSPKHANFIVNDADDTRANDVEDLVDYVRREVEKRFDVRLKPEVVIIGNR